MSELSRIPADVLKTNLLPILGRGEYMNVLESSPTLKKTAIDYRDTNMYWKNRVESKYNKGKEIKGRYNVDWETVYDTLKKNKGKWNKLLFPKEDNIDYLNLAIDMGAEIIHEDLEYENIDIYDTDVDIIIYAAKKGYIHIFKYMLQYMEQYGDIPGKIYKRIVNQAAGSKTDNTDILEILLNIPYIKITPKIAGKALYRAALADNVKIARLLLRYIPEGSDYIMKAIKSSIDYRKWNALRFFLRNHKVTPNMYTSILEYAIENALHQNDDDEPGYGDFNYDILSVARILLKHPQTNPLVIRDSEFWEQYFDEYYNFDFGDIPIREYAVGEERYRGKYYGFEEGKVYAYTFLIIRSSDIILKKYKKDHETYITNDETKYENYIRVRNDLGELFLLAIHEYRNFPAFKYLVKIGAPITYKTVLADAVSKWGMNALKLINSDRLTNYMYNRDRALDLIDAILGESYDEEDERKKKEDEAKKRRIEDMERRIQRRNAGIRRTYGSSYGYNTSSSESSSIEDLDESSEEYNKHTRSTDELEKMIRYLMENDKRKMKSKSYAYAYLKQELNDNPIIVYINKIINISDREDHKFIRR